jgi:muconolactone delta-isomerase
MEYLVEFELKVPDGTSEADLHQRREAEAAASAELGRRGRLVRLWRATLASGRTGAIGLYRAADDEEMQRIITRLPLYDWMRVSVTPLTHHPNDPVPREARAAEARLESGVR